MGIFESVQLCQGSNQHSNGSPGRRRARVRGRTARCGVLASLALGLGLGASPSPADAQTFSVTGNFRQFCCNLIPSFTINDFPFAAGGGGVTIRQGLGGGSALVELGPGPSYSLAFEWREPSRLRARARSKAT